MYSCKFLNVAIAFQRRSVPDETVIAIRSATYESLTIVFEISTIPINTAPRRRKPVPSSNDNNPNINFNTSKKDLIQTAIPKLPRGERGSSQRCTSKLPLSASLNTTKLIITEERERERESGAQLLP